MFDLWFKHWRRRRLLRRPIPRQWPRWLEEGLWQFRLLDESQRQRLLRTVQIFYHEKSFESCQGLSVKDSMKVTIAGAACLLLLGFDDDYCFDRVRTILVYPGAMRLRNREVPVGGIVNSEPWVSGLYSAGDTIVLSWDDAEWECADPGFRANVIIHEFAHHVDDLDGALQGDPPFATAKQNRRWRRLIQDEMERLSDQISVGASTVLRPYALTNLAEFFAVACEAYFCDPHALAEEHPELFAMLQSLFRFDTRLW